MLSCALAEMKVVLQYLVILLIRFLIIFLVLFSSVLLNFIELREYDPCIIENRIKGCHLLMREVGLYRIMIEMVGKILLENDHLRHILYQNMVLVPKCMHVETQHLIYASFYPTKRVL